MSDPIDVKLVLGGPKGEVWVNGVNLAKQVGTVTLDAPPGGPTTVTMEIVPDRIHVEAVGNVDFKCVACGRDMPPPEET